MFLFLVFINACGGQKLKTDTVPQSIKGGSSLELIVSDLYGGTEDTTLTVIRKQEVLQSFYSKVNRTRKPGLKPPIVDFNKEMLLLFCPGKTNKDLQGQKAFLKESEGLLLFGIDDNSTNDKVQTALLQPFYLYKLPLDDREIQFLDQE